MKKRITDEEVGEALGKMADKIRSDMNYELRVARSQMWIAENDLVDTLDEKQKALYEDFCKKREVYYGIAEEMYQKKY